MNLLRSFKFRPATLLFTAVRRVPHDVRLMSVSATAWQFEEDGGSTCKQDMYLTASVGDVLGSRYVVKRKLGWGIYSNVWMVEDTKRNNTHLALKALTSLATLSPQIHELEYMERIQHAEPSHRGFPHVVHLCDHFAHDGPHGDSHLCLVMELMGESPSTFATRCANGRLPPRLAKRITKEVILGLDYLHNACNIIHTDIKTSNILLTCKDPNRLLDSIDPIEYTEVEGSEPALRSQPITLSHLAKADPDLQQADIHAKLIDIGIACWGNKVDEHFTDIIQSTALRAPEVSVGAGWGKPADIWSLGCTVYELVMGDSLFPPDASDHAIPIMQTVVFGDFPPHMLERGKHTSIHYNPNGTLKVDLGVRLPLEESIKEQAAPPDVDVFVDFLKLMLTLDPEQRASLDELLEHEWLREVEM
ncbi:Serine/threonine-protein kinase SRPK [Grifola frondosa]|uniref:non-specific serine/threonine protein kinase n=1 Tax=Grifola frondosa TaxID=5627 RepID=A0A1C7LUZ2_GRIFR|nr:Serine/threonine-protein kinase SRPK [Grifola frondosa]